ncbi:hypothetical protein [Actinomadura litoris]|uniref:hypothetical protein n=1 Tax=Actinomadura litoris TaxID=2678616 RepID=UPI001FA6D0AF|nr:hypothetical protein [Actinomadura litoris]
MAHPAGKPPRRDRRVVEAIAGILADGRTVAAAAAALRRALKPLRLAAAAIRAAADLVRRIPAERQPRATGPTSQRNRRASHHYRAWYLVNAARRIHAAINNRGENQTVADAVRRALRPEMRYLRQHLAAQQNRRRASAATDRMAAIYGDRLGWWSVQDSSATSECHHAHGRDFLVSRPPSMGLPGAVHPHCRCRPVRPWGTRLLT